MQDYESATRFVRLGISSNKNHNLISKFCLDGVRVIPLIADQMRRRYDFHRS
jgi:hypothetical protein